MILTQRQLKHFENFVVENMKQLETYSTDRHDVITLEYIKDSPTLFGGIKEVTWNKVYSFKRIKTPSEKEGYSTYTSSSDFLELQKQLKQIVADDWYSVNAETYKWLQENYPERVI